VNRLLVLSLSGCLAAGTAFGSADDILGETQGRGPELPALGGTAGAFIAGSDSVGPMVMLDTSTGLIPANGVQTLMEGAHGQSSYLVVWQDSRRGVKNDVFAARLGFDGIILDTLNFAVAASDSEEGYPATAFDGTNWLVVWSDLRNGVADIYGARVAADGRVIDTLGFLISGARNTQTIPAVAFNGTNYLVVWSDYRGGSWATYGARVTPACQVLDTAGMLLSGTGCLYPDVVAGDSDWLVAWHDEPAALILAGRVGADGTVRDPGGLVIGEGANDRFFPDAAFDGENYYVVWQDRRQGTRVENWSIYGARISQAGVVLDPTGKPVTNNDSKYEGIPQVWFGDTAYLVSWKDDGNAQLTGARVAKDGTVIDPGGFTLGGMPQWFADIDYDGTNWLVMSSGLREMGGIGGGEDAFATRVTPDASVLDPYPNILLSYSARWQHTPVAAFDGTNWLAVWVEQKKAGETDLRGMLVDAQGNPAGDPFTISGAAGHQTYLAVCAGDSGWLVAWQDYRAGQLDKLYAALVSSSGAVLDSSIAVAVTSDVNRYPEIAFDGTNWLVVFWTWCSDTAYHLYGARITPDGEVLEPNGFNIVRAVYGQGWNYHVSLGLSFSGQNYLAVWPDYRNGNWDIYGVRVTPYGDVLDPGGFVVCRAPQNQDYAALAFGGGRWLATWRDTVASGYRINATLVDTTGKSFDTTGFRVSGATGNSVDPTICFPGTNFLVAWSDRRRGTPDVFAARVSPAGVLLDPEPMPAGTTPQAESYPYVAAGLTNEALVLFHSYAGPPWQCIKVWAGLFTEPVGFAGVPRADAGRRLSIQPNPARGQVEIRFTPGTAGPTSLEIRDLAGRLVRSLPLPRSPAPDPCSLTWDGRDAQGRELANGVYFLKLTAGDYRQTEKLVMQR